MPATCWDVLGIPPTSDLKLIKDTRRLLIRSWHPDVASTPEEKASHTQRCAQINAAYDDAIKFARIRSRILEQNEEAKRRRSVHDSSSAFFSSDRNHVAELVCAVVFFLSIVFLRFLPVVLAFVAGLLVTALIDMLLYYALCRPLIPNLGRNAVWIFLLLVNVLALRLWFTKAGVPFELAVILALPMWLLRNISVTGNL